MKKNGFTFIECILAIGILSIIAISILPIIDTSFSQFSNIEVKNELRNVAQSTIEILKSNNSLSYELIDELKTTALVEVREDYMEKNYMCTIKKLYESDRLMEVEVTAVYSNNKDVEEIALKASIKK